MFPADQPRMVIDRNQKTGDQSRLELLLELRQRHFEHPRQQRQVKAPSNHRRAAEDFEVALAGEEEGGCWSGEESPQARGKSRAAKSSGPGLVIVPCERVTSASRRAAPRRPGAVDRPRCVR